MAHQAHNIPWEVLSSNLQYRFKYKYSNGRTNLFPKEKPDQPQKLAYFTIAFSRTIDEHTTTERLKYADTYDPPGDDEAVVSEITARKVQHLLDSGAQPNQSSWARPAGAPIWRIVDDRTMSFWDRPFHVPKFVGHSVVVDAINALIVYNEMGVLLRITSRPAMALDKDYWKYSDAVDWRNFGLNELVKESLMSYICLNILLRKPELYDDATRKDYLNSRPEKTSEGDFDYRLTSAYQLVVLGCAMNEHPHTLPHRRFFGFRTWPTYYYLNRAQCGLMSLPILDFCLHRGQYSPREDDVWPVMDTFLRRGLPVELALMILEFADYKPQRRLSVPDDPLHIDNRLELRKYLTYCWEVLVRANMLVRFHGYTIDWDSSVRWCLWMLFGATYPQPREDDRVWRVDRSWMHIY